MRVTPDFCWRMILPENRGTLCANAVLRLRDHALNGVVALAVAIVVLAGAAAVDDVAAFDADAPGQGADRLSRCGVDLGADACRPAGTAHFVVRHRNPHILRIRI